MSAVLDSILESLKPYEGEATDMTFYITTSTWGLHGQVLFQYRGSDQRWRMGNVDGSGFMPESAGNRTKFDMRSVKPYFATRDLDVAMPFVADLKSEWMSKNLGEMGLDPQPVVTEEEPVFVDAAWYCGGVVVLSSGRIRGDERRFAFRRIDPVDGVLRTHYYYDRTIGLEEGLRRINREEASSVVPEILDGWWEARMDRIRRLYRSSNDARSGRRAVQTVSETPSPEVKEDE